MCEHPEPSPDVHTTLSMWHREHDCWNRDISRWQADHQRALIELEHIAQEVVHHGEALRRHATDLEGHRQTLTSIEASGQRTFVPTDTISEMTKIHSACLDMHERIRQRHDKVTALLDALSAAVRARL